MPGLIDRIPDILTYYYQSVAKKQDQIATTGKDKTGGVTASLSAAHRFIGVAEYIMNRNVVEFKQRLSQAASYHLELCRRYYNGEIANKSFTSLILYQEVFTALAAQAFDIAEKIACIMSPGEPKEEKKRSPVHQLDFAMGYAIKWSVLNDRDEMKVWSGQLMKQCRGNKSDLRFIGYPLIINAILDDDLVAANDGFVQLIDGHKKLSKKNSIFGDTVDEIVSVWGVGMANLCRLRGLNVNAVPPLIPDDLLLD